MNRVKKATIVICCIAIVVSLSTIITTTVENTKKHEKSIKEQYTFCVTLKNEYKWDNFVCERRVGTQNFCKQMREEYSDYVGDKCNEKVSNN